VPAAVPEIAQIPGILEREDRRKPDGEQRFVGGALF
jgi:hypothetical protein